MSVPSIVEELSELPRPYPATAVASMVERPSTSNDRPHRTTRARVARRGGAL